MNNKNITKRKRSETSGQGTLISFFKKSSDDASVEHPRKKLKMEDSDNEMEDDPQILDSCPSKPSFESSYASHHSIDDYKHSNHVKEKSLPFFANIVAAQEKQKEQLVKYELWSEKYRPKTFSDLLGNHGKIDALRDWLSTWHKKWRKVESNVQKKKARVKASDFQGKSAFIYGKPGIGKTTAARLIAESVGYQVLEMNASDARSKSSLQEHVHQLIDNHPLYRFNSITEHKRSKICLIMDEVDGISSGDRGGVTELLNIIKTSKIPIICIANDGQDRKLKTLRTYSKDLQFESPPPMVILRRIMNICQREKINVTEGTLKNLISSLDGDIRAILTNLQFMSKQESKDKAKALSIDTADSVQKSSQIPNVFSMAECILKYSQDYPANWRNMPNDKKREHLQSCPRPLKQFIEYYFQDTLLIPLLIQQNYINMNPSILKNIPHHMQDQHRMMRIYSAAENISYSDIIERKIREQQAWELAPLHATMSTISPSVYVRGSFQRLLPYDPSQLRFPDILGKQSATRKYSSELNDLSTCISSFGTAYGTELVLDGYIERLDQQFGELLKTQDGIDSALDLMELYNLSRSDLDIISSHAPLIPSGQPSFKSVIANTKKALTKHCKSRFGGESILRATKKSTDGDSSSDDEDDVKPIPLPKKSAKKKL